MVKMNGYENDAVILVYQWNENISCSYFNKYLYIYLYIDSQTSICLPIYHILHDVGCKMLLTN